jgi:UDP-N-acetyl-D-mannosaminuronate dehydrogenase
LSLLSGSLIFTTAEASIDQLKSKIQQQARIGIIGLGYVGLTLALLYREMKFKVSGFDISATVRRKPS